MHVHVYPPNGILKKSSHVISEVSLGRVTVFVVVTIGMCLCRLARMSTMSSNFCSDFSSIPSGTYMQ